MINVISIVEGDGEVAALPVLLRRVSGWLTPQVAINVARPIRVRRDQFLNREDIFSKQLLLASKLCLSPGWIMILLDADDDCPQDLAADIYARAKLILPEREISVVLANHEYEAWFVAAAISLDGKRGFVVPPKIPEAEVLRGPKQWISKQIPQGAYHEVVDQPALSAAIDLTLTHENSRSFRKLCSDWTKLVKTVILV
jgi:hypothetical protein